MVHETIKKWSSSTSKLSHWSSTIFGQVQEHTYDRACAPLILNGTSPKVLSNSQSVCLSEEPEVCQALPKYTNKCMRRGWTHLSKCDRFVPRNIICIFTSKHSTITPIQLLRNLLNKTNIGRRGKISLHIQPFSLSKHRCGKTV